MTDRCYDTLLLNQFHDILPGTCIGEVYETALAQEREAIDALNNRFFKGGRLLNTLSFAREEVVLNDCGGEQSFTDFDGNEKYADLYDFAPFSFGEKPSCRKCAVSSLTRKRAERKRRISRRW